MRELRPEQLPARLAKGPLAPAWLVAGAEPLLVLESVDAIRAAARAEGIAERELFEAEGNQREPDWDAMSASLSAPSLFASRRLVELRLPTGKPGKTGDKLICGFCADPPPDVVLVVIAGEWSRRHGGKWSEAIARSGEVVVAWPVKPHELVGWLERRLRDRGLRADRGAVQLLAERVDGNLLAAAQEVDKLALLAEGGILDAARMQALVGDSARFDVFRLLDAAFNGQPAQVLRVLHALRAEGAAIPALMGMVAKELQTAATLAREHAAGNLARAFQAQRVWDSKQAMYRRALQRHPAAQWARLLAMAGQVDRISKGRGLPGEPEDAWLALERLLLAVADAGAGPMLAKAG
jgi:DNA polymerase III subunit delta